MTSSILPPRSDFAPCSPITQLRASTTLDLPDPFGPTTQVIPGSKLRVVADAKDLNPRNVRLLRCTTDLSSGSIPLVGRESLSPGKALPTLVPAADDPRHVARRAAGVSEAAGPAGTGIAAGFGRLC